MINCRIISVNIEDPEVKESVQEFGHQKDASGNKLRYLKRRRKIKEFIDTTQIDGIQFEILDAITPKDFQKTNNEVLFEGEIFEVGVESVFYISNNLSHYKIWEMEEDTLVLEDDVLFDEQRFRNVVPLIEKFKEIKSNRKILYLQGTHPSLPIDKNLAGVNCGIPDFQIPVFGIDNLSGTGAYFIPQEAKRIIIENIKPLRACDGFMDDYYKAGLIYWFFPKNRNLFLKLDGETLGL